MYEYGEISWHDSTPTMDLKTRLSRELETENPKHIETTTKTKQYTCINFDHVTQDIRGCIDAPLTCHFALGNGIVMWCYSNSASESSVLHSICIYISIIVCIYPI